jgi:AcrR family transcriptional regulator
VGDREDLLAGAMRCWRERGWGRTTVRDIAAVAGVSRAAIGYRFGSREALLTAAVNQTMHDWGSELESAIAAASIDTASPGPAGGEQPDARMWTAMIQSFATQRELWLATVDALVQAEHNPVLREQLADGQERGRRRTAAALLGLEEDAVPDHAVRTLGSVQMALTGVTLQQLLDPDRAPSGPDIVAGIHALAALATADPDGPRPAGG